MAAISLIHTTGDTEMNQKVQAAASALVVAAISALVAFGVLGGEQSGAIQGVALAAIAFIASFGIRSALPPKQ